MTVLAVADALGWLPYDMTRKGKRMTDKNETAALQELGDALIEIEETSRQATDGKWLERLTADCAPLIAEWEVRKADTGRAAYYLHEGMAPA